MLKTNCQYDLKNWQKPTLFYNKEEIVKLLTYRDQTYYRFEVASK